MSGRRTARVAWVLAGITLALTSFGFVVLLATDSTADDAVTFIPSVVLSVVGGLVASRRPDNSIGWLCIVIGLLFALLNLQDAGARWALEHDDEQLMNWIAVPAVWIPAVGLMATHLPLRLPTGTPASERWRRFGHFCTATLALCFVVGSVNLNGSGVDLDGLENPIATDWAESLQFVYVLLPVCILGSIASIVLRFRRSSGTERLQLRWIALGACSAIVLFVAGGSLQVAWLYLAAFAAIPVAIAVAMLRHNLYDIDVVINRTLVYGALTAILAVVYLGSVLLLQLALDGVTSDSNLAIAGSTLAVAAIFRPARGRVQDIVDRRFYRRRYDAQQTLESFSARLRDEIDLTALDAELRGVVAETMQPSHVSLWLRGSPESP